MKTFEELAKDKSGTIYEDWYEDGIRCLIMRGPGALCGYLGIPKDHPLAGRSYDDIPLQVHGGLTFSGEGDSWRPKGFYWYGWDYGHVGDKSFYDLKYPPRIAIEEKVWTVEEVKKEFWSVVYAFKKIMKLSEDIAAKKPSKRIRKR
jgi:hypothetical protein